MGKLNKNLSIITDSSQKGLKTIKMLLALEVLINVKGDDTI